MNWNEMPLTGWGRTTVVEGSVGRPERGSDLAKLLREADGHPLITHGGGRAYGDQALPVEDGKVILTSRMNRMLALDPDAATITVEPGVTFRDLVRSLVPQGLLVPVTPGTAFATIGGAVANDVHGKNHSHGSFGDYVTALELILPDGSEKTVTEAETPELFKATIAGLGLTGLVKSISFQLKTVPGDCMVRRERKINNLEDYLCAFEEENAKGTPYLVGWIDAIARGRKMGRGILEAAEPAAETLGEEPAPDKAVPIDFPGFALNPLSVRAFNMAYYNRIGAKGREALVPFETFFYPLDAMANWNRIYGKRGFYQFQCVVPQADGEQALAKLLDEISRAGAASFLAVLKCMGRRGKGYLSFPMPGYTLALDFPASSKTAELVGTLNKIARDYGGRVYLAKDALLSSDDFEAMYPEADQFRSVLRAIDPAGRMASPMARRLNLTGAGQ